MIPEFIPLIYAAGFAILLGFVGLIWAADRFVSGAAAFALNFGATPMIIGLTIVSFGTSAPEILVSLNASFSGSGDIAVGNALGSNIANIGLVLAITALVARIPVQKHILIDELPILLFVTALAGWFLYDTALNALEGWILLFLLIPLLIYLVWRKRDSMDETEQEAEEDIQAMSNGAAAFWFLLGLAVLLISSHTLVWGARTTAEYFSVSPLIIGLTVLAIGTSLPELAASIASALKGHHEIALGNIVGSNIFNLLAVMSLPGIIAPLGYGTEVFSRDYLMMGGVTVMLALFVGLSFLLNRGGKKHIGRLAGSLLLVSYCAYIYVLYLASS